MLLCQVVAAFPNSFGKLLPIFAQDQRFAVTRGKKGEAWLAAVDVPLGLSKGEQRRGAPQQAAARISAGGVLMQPGAAAVAAAASSPTVQRAVGATKGQQKAAGSSAGERAAGPKAANPTKGAKASNPTKGAKPSTTVPKPSPTVPHPSPTVPGAAGGRAPASSSKPSPKVEKASLKVEKAAKVGAVGSGAAGGAAKAAGAARVALEEAEAYRSQLFAYLRERGGEVPLTNLSSAEPGLRLLVEKPVRPAKTKILQLLRGDARFALREGLPSQWSVAAAPSATGPPL
ncbi:hypothetical protein T484DRAFT_1936128 [Baffinella frigidus]|nr:hypothetical protein T484DRAFT_1936128 [Cryptophyta sp. CCMP2293]